MSLGELEKEISSSEKPVLLEIWSSWCPPCQAMKLIMEDFEEEYKGRIKVLRANPDLNPTLSSYYNIKGVPSFLLFKDGKEVKRETGARSREELSKMIKDFLANEEN